MAFAARTTVIALAALLADKCLLAEPNATAAHHAPQANRTSKELHGASPSSVGAGPSEPRTIGRKLSSDDYNTFSSLTSDVVVETSSPSPSSAAFSKLYPSLTTSTPTFVTRGRYIRNPFYFSKDVEEVEFEDDAQADLLLNGGMPKWNRLNSNYRQLNKYGPTPIEADITVDEDGSTGYGSTFDFGGGGSSSYDSGSYRNPGNGWGGGGGGAGGDMMGWYSEPISQSSRPVPIIAEIRHPSNHKMSFDLSKIGMLALIKIAIAKLKALGFIKAMLLVLFKVKLLILAVAIKFLMLMKLVKFALFLPALFSFSMFFSRLSRLYSLLNQPVLVPNNFGQTDNNVDNNTDQTRSRINLEPQDLLNPKMSYLRQVLRSEKCIERISCRLAGADKPNLLLIWLNWAANPISKFIPSKKVRTFVSTFTEVTNYRLDNLYNRLLPQDWTEWCDEHYSCDEAKHKNV